MSWRELGGPFKGVISCLLWDKHRDFAKQNGGGIEHHLKVGKPSSHWAMASLLNHQAGRSDDPMIPPELHHGEYRFAENQF